VTFQFRQLIFFIAVISIFQFESQAKFSDFVRPHLASARAAQVEAGCFIRLCAAIDHRSRKQPHSKRHLFESAIKMLDKLYYFEGPNQKYPFRSVLHRFSEAYSDRLFQGNGGKDDDLSDAFKVLGYELVAIMRISKLVDFDHFGNTEKNKVQSVEETLIAEKNPSTGNSIESVKDDKIKKTASTVDTKPENKDKAENFKVDSSTDTQELEESIDFVTAAEIKAVCMGLSHHFYGSTTMRAIKAVLRSKRAWIVAITGATTLWYLRGGYCKKTTSANTHHGINIGGYNFRAPNPISNSLNDIKDALSEWRKGTLDEKTGNKIKNENGEDTDVDEKLRDVIGKASKNIDDALRDGGKIDLALAEVKKLNDHIENISKDGGKIDLTLAQIKRIVDVAENLIEGRRALNGTALHMPIHLRFEPENPPPAQEGNDNSSPPSESQPQGGGMFGWVKNPFGRGGDPARNSASNDNDSQQQSDDEEDSDDDSSDFRTPASSPTPDDDL
jgi:hypothetical protein